MTETVPRENAEQMPKAYEPAQFETEIYRFWMRGGYFTPTIDWDKRPFTIIQPPPNVTGALHLGHAQRATMEDIMTRWHRMRGEPTLWLPGEDHAGIAGQLVVEKELAKEGKGRHDLGREAFLERVWEWMRTYRHVIADQHKRLGASCDWTRERFTMDPGPQRAVRTTFVNLYKKGLIYRGERLISWCPRCSTALSDLEVDHQEVESQIYTVRYHLVGPDDQPSPDEYIPMATTRPETILGDTAVAVNPDDPRWQALVGRTAIVPVVGRRIPIVADAHVDPAFGTGAVKVTPAHDPTDFEIGECHHLPMVNVMNLDTTMNENAGPYAGLDRFVARERLVAQLRDEDLLLKVEPYRHSVGHCQRCGTVVEPLLSKQWFVRIQPLAAPAIAAVKDGRIRIVPERFARVYLNWMENIRDWCISRQLWWGHRIPVWYCRDCQGETVTVLDPSQCAHCGGGGLWQDPDVLDTWFSSGLWTHSTLGWPDDTEDLRYFYPTSVMETAYDILFFWVARMIMLGIENMGEIPFHTVYLSGLIRDTEGQKMSKTRGNVLDPLELIDQYGADALRYAVSTGSTPGNDMKLSLEKLENGRNFANKLWNAARFIRLNGGRLAMRFPPIAPDTHVADLWIRSRLHQLIADVDRLTADFQFGEAGRQIYDFIWGEFCDWYIEMAKVRLAGGDSGKDPRPVLGEVLSASLRLLHPYMPFVTEAIWQQFRQDDTELPEALIIAPYPMADSAASRPDMDSSMRLFQDIVTGIRQVRIEQNLPPRTRIPAAIAGHGLRWFLDQNREALARLANVEPKIDSDWQKPGDPDIVSTVAGGCEIYLNTKGLVDREAERARLGKELQEAEQAAERARATLSNPGFLAKAKPEVVEQRRESLAALDDKVTKLQERLMALG